MTINEYLTALSEEPGPNAAPKGNKAGAATKPRLSARSSASLPNTSGPWVAAPDYSLSCEVP